MFSLTILNRGLICSVRTDRPRGGESGQRLPIGHVRPVVLGHASHLQVTDSTKNKHYLLIGRYDEVDRSRLRKKAIYSDFVSVSWLLVHVIYK